MDFKTLYCNGKVHTGSQYDLTIDGIIEEPVRDNKVQYIAAAPADHRANFTGSGLPFANQIQAFDNSPNIGSVTLNAENKFEIKLMTPNSYMVGLGSVTIPPTLYLQYVTVAGQDRLVPIKVSNGIPYRSLTYPNQRSSVDFYASQFGLEVRSQERILREAGYPKTNVMPDNHWGTKPPM